MSHPTPPNENNKNQNLGLTFDWQDWLPYFEDEDIPEAKKQELIETLWQIVVSFVDLGFDLNPHQQAQSGDQKQSCGQNLDLKMLLEAAVLKSNAAKQAAQAANKQKRKEPTP